MTDTVRKQRTKYREKRIMILFFERKKFQNNGKKVSTPSKGFAFSKDFSFYSDYQILQNESLEYNLLPFMTIKSWM